MSLSAHLSNPSHLFTGLWLVLGGIAASWKLLGTKGKSADKIAADSKPAGVKSLQFRFLAVFWLIRIAIRLQAPYFYEVYTSKVIDGVQASLSLVSKIFLVGFTANGLFGPWMGKLVDSVGRKAGTLAFAILYSLSAMSTRSSMLNVLMLGRIAGGIGTCLLFCAPEAWLAGEHERQGFDKKWLGQTFGWAYAGEALIAVFAGGLASACAGQLGPTGPFTVSVAFLLAGAVLAFFTWGENTAASVAAASSSKQEDTYEGKAPPSFNQLDTNGDGVISRSEWNAALQVGVIAPVSFNQIDANDDGVISRSEWNAAVFTGEEGTQDVPQVDMTKPAVTEPNITDALSMIWQDKRILMLGIVQALFEGAMNIFVLQWPPAMKAAIEATSAGAITPYGMIFSCFMTCFLMGSMAFGSFQSNNVAIETSTLLMLGTATSAMVAATCIGSSSLALLIVASFVFESCLGMYFPSIGTLRSKYLPDTHRSVLINLFGVPLNLFVVGVFLFIGKLGLRGALLCSSTALGVATLSMWVLRRMSKKEVA
jgi:MFS family permease